MPRRQRRGVPAKAKEVLRYFLRTPQAADTLEGVARWRLIEETVHRDVHEVDAALRWLVDQGFLVEQPAAGLPLVFRINVEKAAEAEQILGELEFGAHAARRRAD